MSFIEMILKFYENAKQEGTYPDQENSDRPRRLLEGIDEQKVREIYEKYKDEKPLKFAHGLLVLIALDKLYRDDTLERILEENKSLAEFVKQKLMDKYATATALYYLRKGSAENLKKLLEAGLINANLAKKILEEIPFELAKKAPDLLKSIMKIARRAFTKEARYDLLMRRLVDFLEALEADQRLVNEFKQGLNEGYIKPLEFLKAIAYKPYSEHAKSVQELIDLAASKLAEAFDIRTVEVYSRRGDSVRWFKKLDDRDYLKLYKQVLERPEDATEAYKALLELGLSARGFLLSLYNKAKTGYNVRKNEGYYYTTYYCDLYVLDPESRSKIFEVASAEDLRELYKRANYADKIFIFRFLKDPKFEDMLIEKPSFNDVKSKEAYRYNFSQYFSMLKNDPEQGFKALKEKLAEIVKKKIANLHRKLKSPYANLEDAIRALIEQVDEHIKKLYMPEVESILERFEEYSPKPHALVLKIRESLYELEPRGDRDNKYYEPHNFDVLLSELSQYIDEDPKIELFYRAMKLLRDFYRAKHEDAEKEAMRIKELIESHRIPELDYLSALLIAYLGPDKELVEKLYERAKRKGLVALYLSFLEQGEEAIERLKEHLSSKDSFGEAPYRLKSFRPLLTIKAMYEAAKKGNRGHRLYYTTKAFGRLKAIGYNDFLAGFYEELKDAAIQAAFEAGYYSELKSFFKPDKRISCKHQDVRYAIAGLRTARKSDEFLESLDCLMKSAEAKKEKVLRKRLLGFFE